MSEPTTARAQRRQAVADGTASDAVDRRSPRTNPRSRGSETTSRERQQTARREIADEIDIDREGVGSVDRLTGMDVFLRTPGVEQWGDRLRGQFASEADFVEPEDVDPAIDPQEISAFPEVDRTPGREGSPVRRRVAERARRETADELEFIDGDDLSARVGPTGVEDVRVRLGDRAPVIVDTGPRRGDTQEETFLQRFGQVEDRTPVIQSRTAESLAAEDQFSAPDDFRVDVGAFGIEDARMTSMGERRRAGRQFEGETPLGSVDPQRDLIETDDGFALGDGPQREIAAREFESELDQFGTGELDPERDIREIDGGFGLAEDPARQVAADEIDRQIDDFSIGPGDITLEETDSGQFEGFFEAEVSR